MRFTPRRRKAILTLHVITAVGWLGTDLVLLTLGISGLSGAADPAVVYPAMALIGRALFVPLSFVVWVVGVGNALGTPWGLLKWWWVAVKLGIVTVMLGLVVVALYPALSLAADLGARLPQRDRVNLVIAPSVSSSLLVLSTILSTYKPWGRTRRAEQRQRAEQADDPAGAQRLGEQAGQRGQ